VRDELFDGPLIHHLRVGLEQQRIRGRKPDAHPHAVNRKAQPLPLGSAGGCIGERRSVDDEVLQHPPGSGRGLHRPGSAVEGNAAAGERPDGGLRCLSGRGPQIRDGRDLDALGQRIECRGVALRVGRQHDDTPRSLHRVQVHQPLCGAGQHHAG
jgi:hypothetical protein